MKKSLDSYFPNGFISWCETHCEVSMLLESTDRTSGDVQNLLEIQIGVEGSSAYYTLAKNITDEYEELVKGFDYGKHNTMYDEMVQIFFNMKLNHAENIMIHQLVTACESISDAYSGRGQV